MMVWLGLALVGTQLHPPSLMDATTRVLAFVGIGFPAAACGLTAYGLRKGKHPYQWLALFTSIGVGGDALYNMWDVIGIGGEYWALDIVPMLPLVVSSVIILAATVLNRHRFDRMTDS